MGLQFRVGGQHSHCPAAAKHSELHLRVAWSHSDASNQSFPHGSCTTLCANAKQAPAAGYSEHGANLSMLHCSMPKCKRRRAELCIPPPAKAVSVGLYTGSYIAALLTGFCRSGGGTCTCTRAARICVLLRPWKPNSGALAGCSASRTTQPCLRASTAHMHLAPSMQGS